MLDIRKDAIEMANFFIPGTRFPVELKILILDYAGLLRCSRKSVMFVIF